MIGDQKNVCHFETNRGIMSFGFAWLNALHSAFASVCLGSSTFGCHVGHCVTLRIFCANPLLSHHSFVDAENEFCALFVIAHAHYVWQKPLHLTIFFLQKNVGDLIVRSHTLMYGNSQLQYVPGLFHAQFRRVCANDVNIEGTNAMVLGNLPPSGNATAGVVTSADAQSSTEGVLINAFYAGCTLYTPCEEYYFTHNKDEAHMPEAYALELQLICQLASLGEIVNTVDRTGACIVTAPTITDCAFRYQEITLSAAEKENRLRIYSTPNGLSQHILDIEWLEGIELLGTGAPGDFIEQVLPLQSLRKDMAELIFQFNRVTAGATAAEQGTIAPFAGSPMESSTQPSLLFEGGGATQAQGFSTLVPIDSFTIFAANSSLTSAACPDFWNRAMIRKFYHPDSQISDPIYVASFALYPQDYKNATGHLSPSVLGNLQLKIRFLNPGAGVRYRLQFANHCHNAMQSVRGAISNLFQ